MLFNEESIYLLKEDTISEDSVNNIISESGLKLGSIDEEYDFYSEALEDIINANEFWHNMKEKIMSMEHKSTLQTSAGLYSEGAYLYSEAVSGFGEMAKNFFEKVKNIIVKLFNKFVNFATSLFVSKKSVLNIDAGKAWSKRGENFKLKVNVLNVDHNSMVSAPKIAAKQIDNIDDGIKYIINTINSEISKGKKKEVKEAKQVIEYIRDLIDKRVYTKISTGTAVNKNFVSGFIYANILPKKTFDHTTKDDKGNETTEKIRVNTVLQKVSKTIDKANFENRMKYAKEYTSLIAQIKLSRDTAIASCNNAIKETQKYKEDKNGDKSYVAELHKAEINFLRQLANMSSKIYSKLISVCAQYYRECIAIGQRVIAGEKVDKAKKNIKKMAEDK